MTTVEVRSLTSDDLRYVRIEEPIHKSFKTWHELFVKKTNREPTQSEIFYAGYILANPNVRDLFRIFDEKEIKTECNFLK